MAPLADAAGSAVQIGFALAAVSAIFNGTFGIFGKLSKRPIDPVIFNCFLTYGALLSSLVTPLVAPLVVHDGSGIQVIFTAWGALAGAIFVFATLFSFIAIPLAGLATSSATWSCSAVLVSFLWGAVGPTSPPRQPMKEPLVAIIGVVIIVVGILIITFSPQLGTSWRGSGLNEGAESSSEDDRAEDAASYGAMNGEGSSSRSDDGDRRTGVAMEKRSLGILSAMLVGVFGGSVLVPASFVPKAASGLRLLPSFGMGAAVMGTIIAGVYSVMWRKSLAAEVHRDLVLCGMAAGITWNLGNICQIVAQDRYKLAYGIAYPILQCALVFSGLWGIYFFKEETNRRIISVFWLGAGVLIIGVVLLGLFGPGAS